MVAQRLVALAALALSSLEPSTPLAQRFPAASKKALPHPVDSTFGR
jgi:hypothetical protein